MSEQERDVGGNEMSFISPAKTMGSREDTPTFYVDSAQVQSSTYTFLLTMGVASGDDTGEAVRPDVIIRMSPQHAKGLGINLLALVAAYEKVHGTMTIPGLAEFLSGVGVQSDQDQHGGGGGG